MKTKYLLPNVYKKIGWILIVPGMLMAVAMLIFQSSTELNGLSFNVFAIANSEFLEDATYFSIINDNIYDEICSLLLILGFLFVAFSKEKHEDELISKIRLEALVWATYINYGILLFAIIFVYGLPFFWVMIFNMFTILLFFLLKFNWEMYQAKKQISDEK